jgi:hypothetical protein
MNNQGANRDQRIVYLRCDDNTVFPLGYHIFFAAYKPTGSPPNFIRIYKVEPGYVYTQLTPNLEFPWALHTWFTFKVQATGNELKLKVWPKGDPEPEAWLLEAVDPEATYTVGRIGFSDYWGSSTDVDNVVVRDVTIRVDADVAPGSCPNAFNMTPFRNPASNGKPVKHGVLPVALLGTDVLDVTDIDVSSLVLRGVTPLRSDYEDVAAPVSGGGACDCTTAGPDGYVDLTLKFDKAAIAASMEGTGTGDVVTLKLMGNLLDGTPIEARDCVVIRGRPLEPPQPPGADQVVLGPAVPNPFNPSTRIHYTLSGEVHVSLAVYDAMGRFVDRLVDESQPAGEYVVDWDARRMPSGVYFYRIEAGNFTETRKMVMLK